VTVYDLIRHHTSLEVICGNCSDSAVQNNRFLGRRFGMLKALSDFQFVCRLCRS
jgi:hypothetical protein